MGALFILEEEINREIAVKTNSKNIGRAYLSREGAVYKDKKGNPLIILERLGETFIVKAPDAIIGSVYPKNGGYEYKDKDGNVFTLKESWRNEFTFKKDGESDNSTIKISVHPFEGTGGMKSHLDPDYY